MMPEAYEKIYAGYLVRLRGLDVRHLPERLGVEMEDTAVLVPFFGRIYRVSSEGIQGPDGARPPLDLCVILSRYLLVAPPVAAGEEDWVTFRDFKDSGPLTIYFANEVEGAITRRFSQRLSDLAAAGQALGGGGPDIEADCDLALRFEALPVVPLVLLFNDADEEFPARCSLLFERRAERYLDAECLAMLGRRLFLLLSTDLP